MLEYYSVGDWLEYLDLDVRVLQDTSSGAQLK